MNIKTYMISIPAPVPLIIVTSKLFGDTNGKPYLWVVKSEEKELDPSLKIKLYYMEMMESTHLKFVFLKLS